jgi:hypothetical protein
LTFSSFFDNYCTNKHIKKQKMRKIVLGSLVALAACGTPATTEETATVDTTAVFGDSAIVADTTTTSVDTTVVDTVKN